MMIHEKSGSVLLKVQDPLQLRELLPKSRMLPHPDYNIAVQHTLDNVRVLRNLGHEVPAPISAGYNWPGKYTPFDHQRVMAEFMTLNPRCFNLSEMGCVSADTEYLSPVGWKRIDQYTGGPVAQYWPETGQAEFVEPTEYVKKPCSDMIRLKTKYGLDQLLSPEHRVLIGEYRSMSTEVVQAEDLLARQDAWIASKPYAAQIKWNKATIPTTFKLAGPGLEISDAALRVLVAAIADGHFSSQTMRCVIRLKRERKKERLRELLTAAGIEFKDGACVPDGFHRFIFDAPRRVKHFDEWFWAASAAQLEIIAEEVMYWDGCKRAGKSDTFSSYVKESADFVQYACVTAGSVARTFARSRVRRGREEVEYTVTVRKHGRPLLLESRSSTGEKRRVMSWEPSPDGFKYCFMVPSTFLVLRRNGCIFCTGNTGKTASTLWAADWLMSRGHVQRAIVLSPLSTLDRVWKNDVFDVLMHRKCIIVHGSLDKRMKALDTDVDFYILNHDGVAIKEVADHIKRRPDIDLVIVDEASMFRNHDTRKFKALKEMVRPDVRLWLLTGTPCPNAPTDAWALTRLVAPKQVPQFYGSFKRQTMFQETQFKWAPRPEAYTIAYEAMQPAVRFRKADCLDLPPVITLDRECTLTKEQKDAFDTMRSLMIAEAKDRQITAVNAADKITKLRQILCGALKDPNTGDYVTLSHKPRTDVLLECIEGASAKVIVVVPFKGIIQALAEEISKHHSVAVLNGDVSPNARNQIIRDFKSGKNPHVLLCHPKVMAHGLNLTEADTLIFYAPIYSNDEFQQVTERFNRAGQTRKMTIVRIGAHSIEWKIYSVVDGKKVTQDNILSLYNSITA